MTSTTVDRKRKPFSNLLAALSSLALVVVLAGQSTPFIPQAQAAPINERAMIMTATLTESPASIRLDWPTRTTPPPTYNVFRRAKDAQSWGTAIASLPGTALTYTDTNIVVGQTYEYRVAASNSSSYVAYVLAGIKVPVVESRGKVVLLVESEVASALSAELALFTKDLIGDGWTVLRHDVSRDATPESARALVIADYNADRNNVNSVILFGHIPIMKAGNLAPDGHERRPFPADAYYGTMGQWTTTDLYLRSDVELQVGRIDFHNMPAFSKNATELLRQYLNKDHKYRIGQMPVTKDALISDGFGVDSVNNTANANASRLFPILWKNPQVDQGSWQTYLPNNSYTWAHIAGYGGCSLVAAVGGNITTAILAGSNYKMIFGQTLGSYSGEWDCTNNFMRATLALPEYGLTWTWVGRPNWYFHPMGLGETIGYSTKITQNAFNSGRYNDYGMMGGTIHLGLMGDPTLRMYPVFPVTNLSANATSGSTAVSWTASADTGVSNYYVYGAANENGPYTRLGIVSATSYTHTNPGSTQFYMVRASKLEQTGSGSFYNLSQGEFVKASTSVPGAFTLTYNATENGGTTTAAPAQLAGGAAVSLTPTATKSGWTFVGWNTNKDATTALSSYTMPSANATLYAIYSKTMTVTLKDFNGTTAATRTVPVTIFNKATSGSATLPTVNTYTGWTSRGWSTAISGNASVTVVSGAYSVTADATLYAVYQRTLTVTYHADGGTPTPANWTGTQYTNSYNISGTVNPSMTLAAAITKAGFIFDGWVSSASGTKHAAGATVSPYTNTTMKAAWVDQPVTQYAVSYNATENGGTTTATTAQLASGAAVPLTPTATKSGWTFIGWNTNKDATTALTSLTVGTSNITVYAIFSKTLTVTLKDYNGAAATTRTVSVTIYNKATTGPVTLPSVNTYTGWTARGWATATAADAGVTVTSGTYTVSADTTLNGLYQRTLTVTYDAAGGTPTPANWTGTQYTNAANIGVTSDPSMTLAAAITKEGFVFDGWNSGSTKYAAGASATITANTTMTASWVEKPLTTFAVTYDAAKNGGTTTAAPAQLATGAAVPLTPTAVKSGWTFVGWNTNKDASSALTSLTMGTSNVTLYAIYSKTLTVTLKDYNGAAAATRTASVTIFNTATSGEVNIPTVNTYTGWTSQGWASATTATASIVVVSGAYSVSADQTLYGTYQRTLTVTYDANGGTSTPPSTPPSTSPSASPSTPASTMAVQYTNSFAITQTMNPTVTLAAGVTKTGSVFDGWVSSATGTKYAAGASLSLTESLTMTASWVTENVTRFQVTYNATENGGSTAVTTAQVATGAAVDLTLPATKSGWTFVGWNTNKDASTAMTSLTMGSANVTLYAIYSKVITATLKDISGTTETTRTVSETIYNKATAALLKIPATNTYTGWTSRGWALTTSPEAPVALVSGNQTVTDNVTLYGVYLRMLTVTFNANGGRTTPIMQITVQYVNGASVSTPSYPSITLPTGDIRTGYTFDGWVSSVSGTKSPAGSVVSIGANTLFTASWASTTATKYTVTYNYAENGGVFGSLTSDQVTQGALVNLAPVAAKTDWIFLGWNTNKDATTALTSFSMPESNVTLYAIYSRTITVTLKDYSGTEAASRTVSATIFNKATSSSVTLPTVNTFSGWTARGWGMPTGPNPAVVAISGAYTVTENLTLYGLYQRTLTVKYDAAGGTPTPANLTAAQYTSSAAVNSPSTVSFALPAAITRQDFTFDGWVNTTTGTKSAALASVTLNADTTFAAAWVGVKEVTGKVTYNFAENGGVSATITTADATAGEPVKLDSVASKPGWVFVGWNTDKNATTAVSALLMPATDLTLYAIYSKTLTVTLKDYSGLAAATRTVTATLMNKATSGTAMLPTVNEYSGWTSRGWTTGTNANATVLVTSGAYSITADVTLYGLYERKVTATFDPNGGSPAPAQQSATSYMNSYAANSPTAVAFTLPAAITQTGFTFAGWQSSSSGSIIAAGLLVSTTTNTTFKALWSVSGATPRLRTVTYDCTTNGGLITTLWTAQVASGGPVNLSPLAYKPGYNFAGWNTDKNAKTGLSSFTMPDSDVTLYAIFN